MLSLEGRQLGNYDVIRRIRAGGMGAVYEGKQRTAFDRRVAIKVILGNYAADKDMRRRFAREARTVARLHHPHILPLIEYGDEQGILYLVMPFIEGGTLTSYLRRGLPDLTEAPSAIYQQLLDAVEYAHDEGLIHRDIKSSNVLLEQRRSGVPHAYLADFGLVRTSRQAELERATMKVAPTLDQVPGTPHYMAPEQTKGIVTTSSDIYALGVLLYQMLTGELPYDDPDEGQVIQMHLMAPVPFPTDVDASIPIELSEVVRTAMAKRIEDRFGSVAELRQAFLAAIQARAPIKVDPTMDEGAGDHRSGRPQARATARIAPTFRRGQGDHKEERATASQGDHNASPAPMLLVEQRRNKGDHKGSPLQWTRSGRPQANEARARGRQRITDDVRQQKLRTTEPMRGEQGKRKRFVLSVMAIIFVPVMLLSLLIVPRMMGISLFPVGVPLLGADPTATVSVTPQVKNLGDTYILTASPQVTKANVTTREIPDRFVTGAATDSRIVQTTGSAFVAGAQARGYLLFDNSGDVPITVSAGTTFNTLSGVSIQTTESVEVPAQQNGQDGTITAGAISVNAGSVGNIPVNALVRRCCHGLFASNPARFSGGVDAHQVRVVSQADLDGVRGNLSSALQQQVLKLLLKKMAPGEVMAQLPVYSTAVAPSNAVGAQVSQVNVQVTVSSIVIVYNRTVAGMLAGQLLSQQTAQALVSDYKQQGSPSVGVLRVFQQGKNGVIYISVPVREVWVYTISTKELEQWKQSIRGATRNAALAYLNVQGGVQAVQINLPFGTDHFPTAVDQIKIVVV